MPQVVIALGSNVGERLANLRESVARLRAVVEVTALSAVYETAPMYVVDQPPFLNAALLASTDLPPHRLLAKLKETEADMGRHGARRYGPRKIDLDLIAYGNLVYTYTELGTVRLVVPHPRVAERRFVLAPVADVAPDLQLTGIGIVKDLLATTNDQADSVRMLKDAVL